MPSAAATRRFAATDTCPTFSSGVSLGGGPRGGGGVGPAARPERGTPALGAESPSPSARRSAAERPRAGAPAVGRCPAPTSATGLRDGSEPRCRAGPALLRREGSYVACPFLSGTAPKDGALPGGLCGSFVQWFCGTKRGDVESPPVADKRKRGYVLSHFCPKFSVPRCFVKVVDYRQANSRDPSLLHA